MWASLTNRWPLGTPSGSPSGTSVGSPTPGVRSLPPAHPEGPWSPAVGQGQRLNLCISHYVTTKCSYFTATSEIKPGILKPFTVLHKLFKATFRELFQEMRVDRKIFVFQKCLILCRLKFRWMGRGCPAEELLSAATAAHWASTCTHLPTCAPAAAAHLHTCPPVHMRTCPHAHLQGVTKRAQQTFWERHLQYASICGLSQLRCL